MSETKAKIGELITHLIPFRSLVDCKDHWVEIYENIRAGKENIVSAVDTDVDTIRIVTRRIK